MLLVGRSSRWRVGEVFSTPEDVASLRATGQELRLLQDLDNALGYSTENTLVGNWVHADARRVARELYKISPNPALGMYDDAKMQILCTQQTREMKNLFAEHAQQRQKMYGAMLDNKGDHGRAKELP